LPGITAKNPGPGTDSITGIEDNDSCKVIVTELRANKKLAEFIPTITKSTIIIKLYEIINKLNVRVLSDYIIYNNLLFLKIKFNPLPKFNGTRKDDL
ncbi:hypothetical protein QR685DRAFT_450569, partial [Neurospora intermedia]